MVIGRDANDLVVVRYAKCVVPNSKLPSLSRGHTTRLRLLKANMWIEFFTIVSYVSPYPVIPLHHHSSFHLNLLTLTRYSLVIYIALAGHAHRAAKRRTANAEIRMQDLQNRTLQYNGGLSPALHNTAHSIPRLENTAHLIPRPEAVRMW
jgi:hypothetical protein